MSNPLKSSDHVIAAISFDRRDPDNYGWMICYCGWDGPHLLFAAHRTEAIVHANGRKPHHKNEEWGHGRSQAIQDAVKE